MPRRKIDPPKDRLAANRRILKSGRIRVKLIEGVKLDPPLKDEEVPKFLRDSWVQHRKSEPKTKKRSKSSK